MTLIDHDKYTFELPDGWTVESAPTEEVDLHMLYLGPDDKQLPAEELNVVGSISDFTYFVQEGKRKIELYDLVETFETWAHTRKMKFEEPIESTDPRDRIQFEVIGNATSADGRKHLVWLLGDVRTAVRVHFVIKDLNDSARQAMAQAVKLVKSVRIT